MTSEITHLESRLVLKHDQISDIKCKYEALQKEYHTANDELHYQRQNGNKLEKGHIKYTELFDQMQRK